MIIGRLLISFADRGVHPTGNEAEIFIIAILGGIFFAILGGRNILSKKVIRNILADEKSDIFFHSLKIFWNKRKCSIVSGGMDAPVYAEQSLIGCESDVGPIFPV